MANKIIVACNTIADEVRKAVRESGVSYPIIWIRSALHSYPEKLQQELQGQLNMIDNVEHILVCFGSCGNALVGLTSPRAPLVIPRVDDCITLLLPASQERKYSAKDIGSYYLTKGWLENEKNIWDEYQHCVNKYGYERARQVFSIMLANYKHLVLLETGAYEISSCLEEVREIAGELNLELLIKPGSLRLIHKLLAGPWDEEFAIIEPGREVTLQDLGLAGGSGQTQLSLVR